MYDEETNLYYLNARYYDPVTARFLTEDTYLGELTDPLSLNLYAYVLGNPHKYWDPTGHKPDPSKLDNSYIEISKNGVVYELELVKTGSNTQKTVFKVNGEIVNNQVTQDIDAMLLDIYKNDRVFTRDQLELFKTNMGLTGGNYTIGKTTFIYLQAEYELRNGSTKEEAYKKANARLYGTPIIATGNSPSYPSISSLNLPTATGEGIYAPDTSGLATGEAYARSLIDELLRRDRVDNSMINISRFFYQFTYAAEYSQRIYNASTVESSLQVPDLAVAFYSGGASGVAAEILKSLIFSKTISVPTTDGQSSYNFDLSEVEPSLETLLKLAFGDTIAQNVQNRINDFNAVMELKERYAIFPGRQVAGVNANSSWVSIQYNTELGNLKKTVNANANYNENQKYYANKYIDSIIEINNKAVR